MKLILSDLPLKISIQNEDIKLIDLSSLNIQNCKGCFGCWTRTPGKCVIRDDAVKIYPLIAKSDKVIYITRIKYGGYDTVMKTMLERAIPIQQAFIRILDGETHHLQRDVALKDATIIGYGADTEEEQQIFFKLIQRNSKNMNFNKSKIIFADKEDLDAIVTSEVKKWER